MEAKRNERKVREGIVVSDKMDKTVVVLEETMKLHKLYKKRVKTSKKYISILVLTYLKPLCLVHKIPINTI